MDNLAKVIPFRPSVSVVECQVADIDDGYTRIANELLEAVMAADLTARQLKVVLAVIRKTYGFGKKFDRITNTQISAMTGIHHTHVCKAKNEMIAMNIIVTNGLAIGVNKVISDWNISISRHGKTLSETANEALAKSANTNKPTQLNTKETIQKKEKIPLNPPRGNVAGRKKNRFQRKNQQSTIRLLCQHTTAAWETGCRRQRPLTTNVAAASSVCCLS